GYSVTVPLQEKQPLRIPLVDFEQKVVITPLGSRVRIAGTAEFTGYDTTLNTARGGNILRQAIGLLPQLTGPVEQGRAIHWAGLRPMTCDGPPVLGPSPYANLFFNTGHGPLGWTLGAGSARLVADMIAGRQPEIDTRGLLFTRFTH
ncbi:MAG: FAD-dependent oxidoreductase, partial [Gammaproteobacteria bacterium]|nr:FAD-dependent oxidoreductase [Gammaproteobacteria bacterium]